MNGKKFVLFLSIAVTFSFAFCSNADATGVTNEGLSIEFDKGMLSVDINGIDVNVVLGALEEKGNIEIFNKKIVPDRKITLRFSGLETEEGVKKLIHACGVKNYATIFTKERDTGESRIAKLILVKAGTAPVAEVQEKAEAPEAVLSPLVEKEIKATEVREKEIEKGERETLVKRIMPILEGVDEETRQDIIKEIMEGELTILDED